MAHWWQSGIVYQIYPLSFMDSDGDGKGDLEGIRRRLDYLEELGIDAIWMSPIFPSPFADFGYDVADYTDINPVFGTLEIFDRLLTDAHERGLKVILDLVPNHSSSEHEWFLKSRASRENDKRDWYHWKDAKSDGGPPNNWQSFFGGSAWEWDEATGQYYLHLFDKGQPDLNWQNADVRIAIYDAMRFWFERGVDGFRVDVMNLLVKDEEFRDEPGDERWRPGMPSIRKHHHIYTQDQPEVQGIVREMRAVADEYDERVIIGEIYLPVDRLVRYYGENGDGAHLPFNFGLCTNKWNPEKIAGFVRKYEAALPEGGWPNWVLGNHDQPRIATRAGLNQARLAAMLLLTLRGTPTMYYGDELGIENAILSDEYVNDPAATDGELRQPGRDPCRTPMQWNALAHAGFTKGDPWLPVAQDYITRNVAMQTEDEGSILQFYKKLIELRHAEPALHIGDFEHVSVNGDIYCYTRTHAGKRFGVALNFSDEPQPVTLPGAGQIRLSSEQDRVLESTAAEISLAPNEGVIVELI